MALLKQETNNIFFSDENCQTAMKPVNEAIDAGCAT